MKADASVNERAKPVVERDILEEYSSVFEKLTDKQHEVLGLVADNFTSKEIAFELGISESAVNQRIEAVRARTGNPPRAELARVYRKFVQGGPEAETAPDEPALSISSKIFAPQIPQVSHGLMARQRDQQDGGGESYLIGSVASLDARSPWRFAETQPPIVPEVLDGSNAGLSRIAAIVIIAGGMLLVMIVGLGVLRALSDLG
ncbi:helix-turn-helix transcriptional regulator [Novosphingobium sp. 1949]|uniref:Helix-turn-helix transcriptional regulator n=1 Tax=Novosphingobium organovorum TaxID=2930092 RepID=A0ABT0BAF1_9SPHN|nr:helix-turn-helix transcriptional regulator [Novosphingobium organovorum]MCJ2182045.1 helix-turn-helix transcriptional regulator [Novosphingobium organovorum]